MSAPDTITVYSLGACYASVCAPPSATREDVEAAVNRAHPTGLAHGWAVADEPFRTGEPNPHDADGCGRHWLLSC